MIVSVEINNQTYRINAKEPIDISIPLDFGGAQPNAFDAEQASAKVCQTGSLIGDTRRGGSCNFEEYKLIPHCNGTHTECVGHITRRRISVHDSLKDAFIPSTLISVEPVNAGLTNETYSVNLNREDWLITAKSLENALENADGDWLEGLIIRTLPNDESKKSRCYAEHFPPFFSLEAMQVIGEKNVKHLLVDLPSLDRTFDEGRLSAHRIFWNVPPASFDANPASLVNNTITELIFVPDSVADGSYLLNLQIAAFVADGSPSRPVLFDIRIG